MRIHAIAAALLLSACAFSSEEPFFTARDAATPIADGSRFQWIEDGKAEDRALLFEREGRGYRVTRVGENDEQPLHALFIPIRQTREEDYIVQTAIDESGEAAVYVLLWRSGDGFRFITGLGAFGDRPPDTSGLCTPKSYGECAFASREALIRFYRERVYPAFVRGGQAPPEFIDLRPIASAPATRD